MSPRSICLLGRDYPDLGPMGLAGFPDGGALAISRGAFPKSYLHQDPNEDAALLVRDGDAVLIAVADGYNGVAASEVVMGSTREHAARLLADSEKGFCEAVGVLCAEIADRLKRAGRSRTCLMLAALRDGHCDAACFGDSMLFRSSERQPASRVNDLVLGSGDPLPGATLDAWYTGFDCLPGERLAVMTDGVTNFVRRQASLARLLADASDDLAAALQTLQAAMRDGAGDNLAVATVIAPGAP